MSMNVLTKIGEEGGVCVCACPVKEVDLVSPSSVCFDWSLRRPRLPDRPV